LTKLYGCFADFGLPKNKANSRTRLPCSDMFGSYPGNSKDLSLFGMLS
jgi:hypothetical protein